MDMIEGVRAAIKEMMLPELDRIREESKEIKATLVMMNKRLDDVNLHLADQSRRIDETNKRIDETNKRIDSVQSDFITHMNAFATRLDRLYEVVVRRDEHQLAEQRIAILEKDVAEIKYRLAA